MANKVSSIRPRDLRFDDDEDDDDWFDDDEDVESVLDPINAYIVFSDTLQSISANDPNKFKALTETLDFQQQTMMQNLMQLAEQERAKAAAAAAAGAT